jgi:hypothetical protein
MIRLPHSALGISISDTILDVFRGWWMQMGDASLLALLR